jgi:cytidylate kinase
MSRLIVTIDGPAASGKSTIARILAEKLNAAFLDTGAMYRAATVAVMRAGVDMSSQHEVLEILNNTQFEFISTKNGMQARIDGVDVTEQIRDPRVTANARYIAASAPARRILVEMQRRFAESQGRTVTEGRDQGTVAFPDADIKFYLTADLCERAKRRQAELIGKGHQQTIEQICAAIEKRDKSDRERADGPLKQADDAILVDTTDMKPEQVVEQILGYVNEKCSRNP